MTGSDYKILLVDDHDIVLRGMRHLIEDTIGAGCHVDGVKTAKTHCHWPVLAVMIYVSST